MGKAGFTYHQRRDGEDVHWKELTSEGAEAVVRQAVEYLENYQPDTSPEEERTSPETPGAAATLAEEHVPSLALVIERKFLVRPSQVPVELGQYTQSELHQGYIVANDDTQVSLTREGEECFITVEPGQGTLQSVYKGAIPQETFDMLWLTTEDRRLERVRYYIPGADDLTYELDIYRGNLEGFVAVRVAFKDVETAERFQSPSWFGSDVGGDPRYGDSNLAVNGLPG